MDCMCKWNDTLGQLVSNLQIVVLFSCFWWKYNWPLPTYEALVAQMVRAIHTQREGHEFKSRPKLRIVYIYIYILFFFRLKRNFFNCLRGSFFIWFHFCTEFIYVLSGSQHMRPWIGSSAVQSIILAAWRSLVQILSKASEFFSRLNRNFFDCVYHCKDHSWFDI